MTAPFDIAGLRAEFPILGERINGAPLHYLDNGATSQTPTAVLDAVATHETAARANVLRGVHTLAERATEAFENARKDVACYVGAPDADELIFTGGTTSGINLVANAYGALLSEGDEIVISMLEHHSNIVPWQLLRERRGIVLNTLPATEDGRIDLDHLAETVTEKTRLIAMTHVSNVTGAVTDVARIVDAAGAVGAKVLLDGAQAVPHGPIDVAALGIDFYAFSGHKMFAPNGIGGLWAKRELLDQMPPFMGGGEMIRSVTMEKTSYAPPPHKFEAGTPPIAQAVGLAAAARWAMALDDGAVTAHVNRLMGRILEGLGARDAICIIGPEGLQGRAPVISFDIDNVHPHDVCTILDSHGVALRGGHHCAQPLMDHFDLAGTTRASLACYNDDADVDALLAGIDDAIARLA
jgi:cysteine desulfurase/selenocysteine lyase